MANTEENILNDEVDRPVNRELEELKLKRRSQTFWAGVAAVVTGAATGIAAQYRLQQRALLDYLYHRLHLVDAAKINFIPLRDRLSGELAKNLIFDKEKTAGIAAEGWETAFFADETSFLAELEKYRDDINNHSANKTKEAIEAEIAKRFPARNADNFVLEAFLKTCEDTSKNNSTVTVYEKAKRAYKTKLLELAKTYRQRVGPLLEDLEKLKSETVNPSTEKTLKSLEDKILKEQENLRYLVSNAWKKEFEETIFKNMIKGGNEGVGRMGLGLRQVDGKGRVIGISAAIGTGIGMIVYGAIRLFQFHKEDKQHQAALAKTAVLPSEQAYAVEEQDLAAIAPSEEKKPSFAAGLKPSESAVGKVTEQRSAAENSAGLSI